MSTWNYLKLIPSFNLNELGKATQDDCIFGNYDQESKLNIEIVRSNQFLPAQTKFPNLKLYPEAKFTDILYPSYFSSRGFLLSQRSIYIFSMLKLDVHQLFKCFLYLNDEPRKYSVLYLPMDRVDEIVDWNSCVFTYWKQFGDIELDRVQIYSQKDFHTKRQKINNLDLKGVDKVGIRLKTLKLKQGNESSFDLIKIGRPASGFYVSPRFIDVISQNYLTGFAFQEIDNWNENNANVTPWAGFKP